MIGEKLGSFRIEAVLGTGAMGVVYKAVNENTSREAAVKVISGEISQRSKSYERFRRESEILRQFRHPNIVRFLALGRYKGTSYFAMEYVQGQTLEAILTRRGPLPWREVVTLSIQICEALHYAHEHGVIHRDLKPSNLMVTAQGQIKLTDFGIAKDLDATALTATGRTLGTAAYMAPEQIRGTPEVSHKTDLYALGVVLYQVLTGQPAFEATSAVVLMHCHLNEAPPKPSSKVPEIPVVLDDLIVQLMAKSPADRPFDAAAVAQTLTELNDQVRRGAKIRMVWSEEQAQNTHPSRLGKLIPRKPKKKRDRDSSEIESGRRARAWIEIGLLVLALVASGGLIGYLLWPPSREYLYHKAEVLMASKERHDWERALEYYVDPLDRRFPDNPWHEITQGWRDKVLLARAEGRAGMLEPGLITKFNHPQNTAEEKFVTYHSMAQEATKNGDELTAAEEWRRLASNLDPNDSEERSWFLLAQQRAALLDRQIEQRHKFIIERLNEADVQKRAGDIRRAEDIRRDVFKRYSRYKDFVEQYGPNPFDPANQGQPSKSTAPAPNTSATPRPTPEQSTSYANPGNAPRSP